MLLAVQLGVFDNFGKPKSQVGLFLAERLYKSIETGGKIEHLLTTLKAIEEMPTKRATEFQFNALQFELLGCKVVEMREHLRLHADLPASSKDHCGPYFEELMLRVEKKQEFNARMLWQ